MSRPALSIAVQVEEVGAQPAGGEPEQEGHQRALAAFHKAFVDVGIPRRRGICSCRGG